MTCEKGHYVRTPLVLALVTASSLALAEPSGSEKALAEALFRDGRTLMTAGKAVEACAKFAESEGLDPKMGTLLNLAVCHEQTGRTASAWAEYVEVASRARRAGLADRESFAQGKAIELEKRLSRVRIVLDGPPAAGQELTLDHKSLPLSAAGTTALPLDPGPHQLEARATGKTAWSNAFNVDPQPGVQEVHVPPLADAPAEPMAHPGPAPIAPTGAAPPSADHAGSRRPYVYAAGAVGVVGVAVGTVFGLRTFSKKHDGDAHCSANVCDATGISLQNDAHSAATVSTVAFAVGAVGLAAGAYFFFTEPPSASATSGRRLELAPSIAKGTGSMTLRGAW